jgi:hypothetical protein
MWHGHMSIKNHFRRIKILMILTYGIMITKINFGQTKTIKSSYIHKYVDNCIG